MAELHPMELGEILDGALTIFRRHFGLFVKIGIVALWLPVALTIYIQLAGGRDQHLLMYFMAQVIAYFGGLFLTAAAIRVISDSYLGRPPELGEALSLGGSKIVPLFVVGLGKGIVIGLLAGVIGVVAAVAVPVVARGGSGAAFIAVVLAILGGCWFIAFVLCGYAVTTPVIVLEDLGGAFDAFGRSWDLTRDFKRKVFGIAVVAFLMVYVPILSLAALGGFLRVDSPVVGQAIEVASAALPIVVAPLLSCVFTLMYYDLRVRREAFDLQILGQQLGIR
jgi:hypothetical protein